MRGAEQELGLTTARDAHTSPLLAGWREKQRSGDEETQEGQCKGEEQAQGPIMSLARQSV